MQIASCFFLDAILHHLVRGALKEIQILNCGLFGFCGADPPPPFRTFSLFVTYYILKLPLKRIIPHLGGRGECSVILQVIRMGFPFIDRGHRGEKRFCVFLRFSQSVFCTYELTNIFLDISSLRLERCLIKSNFDRFIQHYF